MTRGGFTKTLDEQGIATRNDMMEDIHEYLTTRDKTESSKILEIIRGRAKNNPNSRANMIEVTNALDSIRNHIDDLSTELSKNPLAKSHSDDFVQVVADNVGEYLTRNYKAFGRDKKDYIAKLSGSPEGRAIIDRAKGFIASKNPEYGQVIRGPKDDIIGFKPFNEG